MKYKKKDSSSMVSNIFYFIRLMFKHSPGLVIGEILWGVIEKLPTRIVAVVGVKYIIDTVTGNGDKRNIIKAIIAIALVLLLSELAIALFREFYWNAEKERASKALNQTLYEKAKILDLENYDNPHFYNNFILTIQASADNIQNVLSYVRHYIGELVSLFTICSILLTIDPFCLLIIIAIVIIFTPISKKIGTLQMQRRIDNNRLHRRADYFARVFYLQDYAKEVRMNNIKPLLMKRYNEAAQTVCDNQVKYVRKIDILYFIQETGVQILGFMFLLPLYLGYCVLEKHSLSAGDFVAAFNGATSIAFSFSFLTVSAVRNFSEQAKMIEKYREFLKTEPTILDGEKNIPCEKPKNIEIKNLSFTYPGNDKPTLEDINITIKPYEKIALVGYNGAGKTTLTNLLLRLYDASDGEILIDNENIKDVTLESHRNRFSAVFQDFQLFACSMGENVALDTNPDKERVMSSLKHSGFDKDLPNGADTEILREFDDNGVMTSGGEAQKIAISRAFYKKCPYVILDEPSANLDPVAEYNLNQAMMEAAKDKTVIFISHRLSTTINADKIYVMEKGRIIESGSHRELMELNKTYAYMFNLQAEKYRKS
ncbi:MAG: ABC transporter ATP-binding protein/permease [Acetobacter sp.]|nr:ABC transporter ATP-binding protein/permease [Bacteroides sp.]MCM1340980.1 ABC transporter ATP-binding protein/permease [Acetobacter sp.]MCM1432464.1 ABC transporter ATP-binding protein/permease [Clostridiales bacterium]